MEGGRVIHVRWSKYKYYIFHYLNTVTESLGTVMRKSLGIFLENCEKPAATRD